MFYPDVKPHISPSALQTWHENRQTFIRSYFKEEHGIETRAMKDGTKMHGLVEGAFITPTHAYGNREHDLKVPFKDTGVLVYGKPDDYGMKETTDVAAFVDYKFGKDSDWSREVLAADLKMRTTAWLVWQTMGKPTGGVIGYIEWFGMRWNGTENVPTNEDHAVFHCHYTAEELTQFELVIGKTIEEVNEAYEHFLNSKDAFVNEELTREYAELDAQVKQIEESQIASIKARMEEIKTTIAEQMEFGDIPSHEAESGTFYWRTNKTYDYPAALEFQTEYGGVMTLAVGEEVIAAVGAAKKHFELSHDPVKVTKSLSYRAKKQK